MSKIDLFESLKKALPSEMVNDVTSAVDAILAESKAEMKADLEAEANVELEKAYSGAAQELAEAEKVAIQGYQDAYNVINELRNRLEMQTEEFEKELISGWEEAYKVIKEEKAKNGTLELDLHAEYNSKFNEVRTFMVEKLDEFLQQKGKEIYEQARRDILADPRYAQDRVVLDKVVEDVATYLSDEEKVFATGAKLEESQRQIEDLKAQVQFMEARQIRLNGENRKLLESVRTKDKMLSEAVQSDRKERSKKAKQVSGKGYIDNRVPKRDIIQEYDESHYDESHYADDDADETQEEEDTDQLFEGYEGANLDTLNLLAGTKETKRRSKSKKNRN
jgi:hypothetical protein